MVRHGTKGARVGLAHVALFLLSAASLALASTTQHVSQNKHFGHARQAKELPKQNPSHAYVAACVLAKNEHLYIREFIQYHHWIGIDKFYVWDHQSSPPMADVLEDYVLSSLVEVFYFSDSWKADDAHHRSLYNTSTRAFLSPQGWAYDNCFRCVSAARDVARGWTAVLETVRAQAGIPSFNAPGCVHVPSAGPIGVVTAAMTVHSGGSPPACAPAACSPTATPSWSSSTQMSTLSSNSSRCSSRPQRPVRPPARTQ